ncbi:MAG: LPS export ABC transporter periplasmic protein LptC [Candidatus Eremiobacteraeota bacterium]|nr:LPS export ABC transporter periplasmic protein LptC [Candidatus Eremiobacteraeota bacterium]
MPSAYRWRSCLAALPILLCACNPQAPKTNSTPAASGAAQARPGTTPPPLHITGQGSARRPVRIIQQVQNRIEYELIAKSYESKGAQGKARAVFQDARVTFYDRNGKSMTATAPQAILDENTNAVTLVDAVHATTSTGMALQCSRLVYDRTGQMLHGDGNVVITDPNGFRGTGSSFDSDISLTHVQML